MIQINQNQFLKRYSRFRNLRLESLFKANNITKLIQLLKKFQNQKILNLEQYNSNFQNNFNKKETSTTNFNTKLLIMKNVYKSGEFISQPIINYYKKECIPITQKRFDKSVNEFDSFNIEKNMKQQQRNIDKQQKTVYQDIETYKWNIEQVRCKSSSNNLLNISYKTVSDKAYKLVILAVISIILALIGCEKTFNHIRKHLNIITNNQNKGKLQNNANRPKVLYTNQQMYSLTNIIMEIYRKILLAKYIWNIRITSLKLNSICMIRVSSLHHQSVQIIQIFNQGSSERYISRFVRLQLRSYCIIISQIPINLITQLRSHRH